MLCGEFLIKGNEMRKLNVLSLFNGMSFGMMALETLDVEVGNYYSSEIDKYANQATQALYPEIIQMGDVTKWREWDVALSDIDLLLAGFPCQAWSMAGKQKGDSDPRGALVHDLINIWKAINEARMTRGKSPVKFMFENVRMKKEFLDYINDLFGVEPACINSALVSAQNRNRYYWTNIGKIEQPEDKGIMLTDVIEPDGESGASYNRKEGLGSSLSKSHVLSASDWRGLNRNQNQTAIIQRPRGNNPGGLRALDGKAPCVGASSWQENNHLVIKSGARRSRGDEVRTDNKANCLLSDGHQSRWLSKDDIFYRKLTVKECMRLQTVPERHINTLLGAGISNTQLYKMTGNGWTHDVIVHIFKGLLQ
jgi:DNA-cytosine methyltransferase